MLKESDDGGNWGADGKRQSVKSARGLSSLLGRCAEMRNPPECSFLQ